MELCSVKGALMKITMYLNDGTDLEDKKKVNRDNRAVSRVARGNSCQKLPESTTSPASELEINAVFI